MRKSRSITITILAGVMLTGCCIFSQGCGSRRTIQQQHQDPPDYTWYDANGNRIEEKWKTDANGNKVLDEQGRPIPEPGIPHDRYHRPWVFVNNVWAPLAPPIRYTTSSSSSSSSASRSSSWLFGGSGYRSTGTTTTYRPSGGSSSSSGSSLPSGSSITRGGFGSTGSSSSS